MNSKFLSIIAAIAGMFAAAGCSVHDTTPHAVERGELRGPRTKMDFQPPGRGAYEKDALHQLSDHQASTVALAKLAGQKAPNGELKSDAANAAHQSKSRIATMRKWLADWYGRDLAPHVADDFQPTLDRLASLSGGEFDRAYLTESIRHHEAGSELAKILAERATHPDVLVFARQAADEEAKQAVAQTAQLRNEYGDRAATNPS